MSAANNSLGKPKPLRFEAEQWTAMQYIAQRNHGMPIAKVARLGADFLIRATELNGGIVPFPEQLLIKRAKRDARRSR